MVSKSSTGSVKQHNLPKNQKLFAGLISQWSMGSDRYFFVAPNKPVGIACRIVQESANPVYA
jgi:hypothetical protein